MEETINLKLTVNGAAVERPGVPARKLLVDFLNEELDLTGTKLGCGVGACGTCKVALRESPEHPLMAVLGCYARLNSVNDMHVTTVEALADPDGTLHALQEAFLEDYAFQCGFCTPGFLMAAYVLMENLRHRPVSLRFLDQTVLNAINGNLCRCTGYVRYFDAVKRVILASPGLVVEDALGPTAISPSGICFRINKRSSNDLEDKPLIGFFENPEGRAEFSGKLDFDVCRAYLSAKTNTIRTGERVRDLNLCRFFFVRRDEIRFDLSDVEALDPRLDIKTVPFGTPIPVVARGFISFSNKGVSGDVRLPVETELIVRILTQGQVNLTSREPLRFDPRDLDLPIVAFAKEFGLKFSALVEVTLDALIPFEVI